MQPTDLAFPRDALSVPAGRAPVRVTWLGTAGFAIAHDGWTILIDPYVTRASLWRCVSGPLASDPAAVRRFVPEASAIVTGHTHFDHVLDVPAIARATGATVYGSTSCVRLCRAERVEESKLVDVEAEIAREPFRVEVGPFELRFVPSVHSGLVLGRVPLPGDIDDCDRVPLHARQYRCGAVFGIDIRVAGRRLYHLGSADLVDSACERDVDLLMLCVAGWTTTQRYVPRVMSALRPGAILLSHWDDFFSPIDAGARALPAMRMPRLVDALSAEDRSVKIGTVPILGSVEL